MEREPWSRETEWGKKEMQRRAQETESQLWEEKQEERGSRVRVERRHRERGPASRAQELEA